MQPLHKYRVLSADEVQQDAPQEAAADNPPAPTVPAEKINIAMAMLPFTAMPFSGSTAIYAWGRLVLYGGLAVVLHGKHKTASYTFAGAAGLSLLTSLANGGQK